MIFTTEIVSSSENKRAYNISHTPVQLQGQDLLQSMPSVVRLGARVALNLENNIAKSYSTFLLFSLF